MAILKTQKLGPKEWSPTAVGSSETTPLFQVPRGWRCSAASYKVLTASAASSAVTVSLGDGVTPAGLIAAFDPETATMAAGAGTYLAASGGKLYDVDDTIDVVYTVTTAGATNPKVAFCVVLEQDF